MPTSSSSGVLALFHSRNKLLCRFEAYSYVFTAQTTGLWKTACDSLAQTRETAQIIIYGSRILEGSATCNLCVRDFEIRPVYTTKISGFQKRFPDFRWDFRIAQALAGISDYKQKFREISGKILRDFWISGKFLIACDF